MQNFWDGINERIAEWERKHIIEPGDEYIADQVGPRVGKFFADVGTAAWDWFVVSLPDIIGYSTLVAGACVIVGSMVGRGGILKPMGVLAGGTIAALCILEAVY
ncbi:hypothetical protein [Sporosarcina sp. ITBMC105]